MKAEEIFQDIAVIQHLIFLSGQFWREKNKGEYLRNVGILRAWQKRRQTVPLWPKSWLRRNFKLRKKKLQKHVPEHMIHYWVPAQRKLESSFLLAFPNMLYLNNSFSFCVLSGLQMSADFLRQALSLHFGVFTAPSPAGSHCCLALRLLPDASKSIGKDIFLELRKVSFENCVPGTGMHKMQDILRQVI